MKDECCGSHRHCCPKCGYVWAHPDSLVSRPPIEHTCPVCGFWKCRSSWKDDDSTYVKYRGDVPAGQFVVPAPSPCAVVEDPCCE